jgi:hypothetical protein
MSLLYNADFMKRRMEERTHVDLNGDGRIGRPGPSGRLEQATHIDLNRDGYICDSPCYYYLLYPSRPHFFLRRW